MAGNKDIHALERMTVEQVKAIGAKRAFNRRKFMARFGLAGAAAGVGLLAGCNGNGTSSMGTGLSGVTAQGPSESDVLNFALNLEYLEATFYSFVTQGVDLPSSLIAGSGQITGAPTGKIAFPNQQITDLFNEIFFNEMSHVEDLQKLIGSGFVQRPALNLAAAAPVTSANVMTIARQFEDAGTTAYAGAVGLLTGTNLTYAAQILAVEGFQAGAVRLIAIQQGIKFAALDAMDIPTADPGAAILAAQGPNASGGFFATSGTATATMPAALAFTRTTSQILQIVYGAPGQTGVAKGGFFPSGMNGNITTS